MRLYRFMYLVYLLVISLLVLDAFGFLMWSMSSQMPTDNYYAGVITKTILAIIF